MSGEGSTITETGDCNSPLVTCGKRDIGGQAGREKIAFGLGFQIFRMIQIWFVGSKGNQELLKEEGRIDATIRGFENITGFKMCYKTYREIKLKCFVVSVFVSLVQQALISYVCLAKAIASWKEDSSIPHCFKKQISHILF